MKIAYVDRFFPYYICSAGCHLFNLYNKNHTIYSSHGLPVDTRMHIFFVTQPGFGKTFHMRVLGHEDLGLFSHTDVGPVWEDRMTEARFSGTVYTGSNGVKKRKGAAWEYRKNVLCVDEFHALSETMVTSHSSTLEDALCTALESGYVRKGLGQDKLNYKTNLTLWTGAQPLRYDLSQGTGRRFLFLEFIPSENDRKRLLEANREGENVGHDSIAIDKIRRNIKNIYMDLHNVENVIFDKSFYDYINQFNIMPYEQIIYKKIGLGYTVMSKSFTDEIVVSYDRELKNLLDFEYIWRADVKRGPDLSQVLQIIKDLKTKHGEDWVPERSVRDILADFGINYHQGNQMIYDCQKEDLISRERKKSYRNKTEQCLKLLE
jgi:hypothetical protein